MSDNEPKRRSMLDTMSPHMRKKFDDETERVLQKIHAVREAYAARHGDYPRALRIGLAAFDAIRDRLDTGTGGPYRFAGSRLWVGSYADRDLYHVEAVEERGTDDPA